MVKGNTDVEMKDVSSPTKKEKVEKVNGVAEEEPPKDPDLLTLEGSRILTAEGIPVYWQKQKLNITSVLLTFI